MTSMHGWDSVAGLTSPTKYADLLLRRQSDQIAQPKGVGISLSFAVFQGRVDDIADRARSHGAQLTTEAHNQPWNSRDFSLQDPDGFLLTFTQGPVDAGASMETVFRRGSESAP